MNRICEQKDGNSIKSKGYVREWDFSVFEKRGLVLIDYIGLRINPAGREKGDTTYAKTEYI